METKRDELKHGLDRGDRRLCDRGCDPPSSPAAVRNVEKLQRTAPAPHLGFEGTDSTIYSKQHTKTHDHMA